MKIISALIFFLNVTTGYAQMQVTDSSVSVKDNSIFSESNNCNGSGSLMFIGRNGQGNFRRGLIKFSTLSIHPDSVQSISVRININQVSNTGARTLSLHKIINDWGEGTSNSASGSGGAPATNDATWNFRFYNTQSWSAAGGDYVPSASGTTTVSDVGFYTFSGAGLLADYRSWISNPASNFGWVIIGDEAVNNSAKRMDSRESTAGNVPKIFASFSVVVLPLRITKIDVTNYVGHNLLQWQVLSRSGILYFDIEHSVDGVNFVSIGRVSASQFSHYGVDAGKHFYRVVQVDRSGAKFYSNIVSTTTLRVQPGFSPNPVKNFLAFRSAVNYNGYAYTILNVLGNRVKSGILSRNLIDVINLPSGVYMLKLDGGPHIITGIFVK